MSSSYRLREVIIRKWQRLASPREKKRSKGLFVVYAEGGKRFVVPLKYLDHPIFRVLLEMAEEEFGSMVRGPLRVPCEEELMDHIVSLLGRNLEEDVERDLVSLRGVGVLRGSLPSSLYHDFSEMKLAVGFFVHLLQSVISLHAPV